jgi:hypothetical protein
VMDLETLFHILELHLTLPIHRHSRESGNPGPWVSWSAPLE